MKMFTHEIQSDLFFAFDLNWVPGLGSSWKTQKAQEAGVMMHRDFIFNWE